MYHSTFNIITNRYIPIWVSTHITQRVLMANGVYKNYKYAGTQPPASIIKINFSIFFLLFFFRDEGIRLGWGAS